MSPYGFLPQERRRNAKEGRFTHVKGALHLLFEFQVNQFMRTTMPQLS